MNNYFLEWCWEEVMSKINPQRKKRGDVYAKRVTG